MTRSHANIAVVVIGRNEGERLRRSLDSVRAQMVRTIYVDSGSTDGSASYARSIGVEVVELDRQSPFTAARARNAGFIALKETGDLPDYVQFIDGDCQLMPGWIEAGVDFLEANPYHGLVTGWRSEAHEDRSIYNSMCAVEWHRPPGKIKTCGGDMIVRRVAFETLGGMDSTLIAGEDEEFCLRLAQAGWRLERLPLSMTLHDAAMTRFSEWWKRTVRSGHAFAQIGQMHPDHFQLERIRIVIYAILMPLLLISGVTFVLIGGNFLGYLMILTVLFVYVSNWLKTTWGLMKFGLPISKAAQQAFFILVSKLPNLIGAVIYYWRRSKRHEMHLIEYK